MTKEPNVIGVKVLEQNGVNVKELIKALVHNASVEFTAYYYFTNLRAHCVGMEGEGIKGVIEDARMEDLIHFESCLSRIYELGGNYLSMHRILLRCQNVSFSNSQQIQLIQRQFWKNV
jgi:ferritin-like protein